MNRLIRIPVVVVLTLIMVSFLPWTTFAQQETSSSIEQTFQKARQDYLQKNMDSAAEQIKKSSAYMKAEAAQASARGKDALSASARELDKLADDVKSGAVTSQKRMEDTFARAYLALASNEHIKSTESWAREEKAKAGAALESANTYLEKSFSWAGQKIEKGTNDVMKKSEALALKLRAKGSLVAEEVGKGLQDAGNEIKNLGGRISSR